MNRKITIVLVFCMLIVGLLSGCNSVARTFGGTQTVNLPANQKLVNVTWKKNDLWVLSRPMQVGETAESYKFQEKSNLGILEGTVKLNEKVK